MAEGQIVVGMSEIKVAQGEAVMCCLGLGSCIGLIGHDAEVNVTAMVHIMLPEAFKDKPVDKPGKFADTAIPELIKVLESHGASIARTKFAYAGGAQVFQFGNNAEGRLDVGSRNAEAVAKLLAKYGIRVVAKDVGGNSGRTVTFKVSDAIVKVRTVHSGESELCSLRSKIVRAAA